MSIGQQRSRFRQSILLLASEISMNLHLWIVLNTFTHLVGSCSAVKDHPWDLDRMDYKGQPLLIG